MHMNPKLTPSYTKLHQTYINNMTKNNTHKIQGIDTNR